MASDRGTPDGVASVASGRPGDSDILLRLASALYEAVWKRDLRTGVVDVRSGFHLFGYAPEDLQDLARFMELRQKTIEGAKVLSLR